MRANQASQALIKYEAGQDFVAMQQMTDSGDNTTFSVDDTPWSNKAGFEADIRPDGLRTGGVIAAVSGSNDTVSISDLTCYIGGEEVEVTSIADQTIDRSEEYTPGETYLITAITVTSGGAIALIEGAEGASFSTTRGGDGGPPYIPTTSIEIGWVRLNATASADIDDSEIMQIPGTSTERADYPVYEDDITNGEITFIDALDEIHSDDAGGTTVTKGIYCEVYTPVFASLEPASDFVPPETTHSQSSTQVYGGTIGSSSSSLNQGSFTAFLKDGVTDPFVALKNQILWFQFFPNRLRDPYILANGTLGISRTFPAGDSIQAACTISAVEAAVEFEE